MSGMVTVREWVEAIGKEVELPPLLPWQHEFVRGMRTFNIIAAARRSGKTTLACWISLREALQGGLVWWVAPTYNMADRGWRDVLVPLAERFGGKVRKKDKIVEFIGGGRVQALSAEREADLTGSGLSLVVVDEADHPRLDRSLLSTYLLPALIDRAGKLLLISALYPNGGNGWFRELLAYAQSGQDPDWWGMVVTAEENILLSRTATERVRRAMELLDPLSAAQQLDVMERAGGTRRLFPDLERFLVDRVEGRIGPVVMGLDPGGFSDPTAMVLVDLGHSPPVAFQAFLVPPGRTAGEVADEALEIARTFGVDLITVERNGAGTMVAAELMRRGEARVYPVFTSDEKKVEWVGRLAEMLRRGELRVAKVPELVDQLARASVAGRGRGGPKVVVEGAPHDDVWMALLLAVAGMDAMQVPIGG